ncbi:MAG TPA: hypothetical protein VGR19_11370 [Allosphingosinicella sp.]|nr:hypothetical protein [Allosphingosinicella sp.]
MAVKKPALFMMGQDVRKMEQKLGARGSTTTLLIVGGVVLVGVAALLIMSDCDACDVEPASQ